MLRNQLVMTGVAIHAAISLALGQETPKPTPTLVEDLAQAGCENTNTQYEVTGYVKKSAREEIFTMFPGNAQVPASGVVHTTYHLHNSPEPESAYITVLDKEGEVHLPLTSVLSSSSNYSQKVTVTGGLEIDKAYDGSDQCVLVVDDAIVADNK